MIFTQHYLACLSHASYLVGDETTGRAVVVDPRRDVDVYLEEAAAKGLTIERVIETHVHADFLSGHLELAAATGAVISYGEGADVEFAIEPLARRSAAVARRRHARDPRDPGPHARVDLHRRLRARRTTRCPTACSPATRCSSATSGVPICWPRRAPAFSADALARHALPIAARQAAARSPTRPASSPPTARARRAASSCRARRARRSASSGGRTTRCSPMSEDEFVAAVTEGQPVAPPLLRVRRAAQPRAAPAARRDDAPPLLDIDEVLAAPRRGRGAARRPRARRLRRRPPPRRGERRAAGPVRRMGGRRADARSRHRARRRSRRSRLEAKIRLGRVGFDRVVGQLDDPASVFAQPPDLIETSSRLTIEQLAELRGLEPDLQLVDVRGPGETAGGHAARGAGDPAGRADRLARRARPGSARSSCTARAATAPRSRRACCSRPASPTSPICSAATARGTAPGCRSSTARTRRATSAATPQVGARAAKALVDAGALLLDVREPDEWEAGQRPARR